MGRAHRDQHDLLLRLQWADPMNDQCIDQIPAGAGLLKNLFKRFFGHAGIMFQRHGSHAAAIVHVAHGADEADDRAHSGLIGA